MLPCFLSIYAILIHQISKLDLPTIIVYFEVYHLKCMHYFYKIILVSN